MDMQERKHLCKHFRLLRLCGPRPRSVSTRETTCQRQCSRIDDETIHQIRVLHLDNRITKMTGITTVVKRNGSYHEGMIMMILEEEGGTTLRDGIKMMKDCTRTITIHEIDARRDKTTQTMLDEIGTKTYDERIVTNWQPEQKPRSPQEALLMESTPSEESGMTKSDVVHLKEISEMMTKDGIGMRNGRRKGRRKERQESPRGTWMHVLSRRDLLNLHPTQETQDQHWSRTLPNSHDIVVM